MRYSVNYDKENMRPVTKEVYKAYKNKGYTDGYNQALEDFSEKLCTILEECQTGFNMVSMANVWHFSKEIKEELTR